MVENAWAQDDARSSQGGKGWRSVWCMLDNGEAIVSTRNVQFGWRIPCYHDGCSRFVECWTDINKCVSGPPSVRQPTDGSFVDSHSFTPGISVHVAYCPEHAGPAFIWVSALKLWRAERRHVGRKTFFELIQTVDYMGMLNRTIGREVSSWEAKNPRPIPPWHAS